MILVPTCGAGVWGLLHDMPSGWDGSCGEFDTGCLSPLGRDRLPCRDSQAGLE